jgi:hypothetical protein
VKPCLAVLLVLGPAVCSAQQRDHVYTNDDLARLSASRGETGVLSQPDRAREPANTRDAASRATAARHGEAYWRQQAEALRRRLEALRDRIQQVRRRMDERAARPKRRGAPETDPLRDSDLAAIARLRARLHDEEDRFLERARREGALPGWLR